MKFSEVEGWTRKYCFSQQWKTAPNYLADDLLQECWIIFNKIKKLKLDPAHAKNTYYRSVKNKVVDMSRERTRTKMASSENVEPLVTPKLHLDSVETLCASFCRRALAKWPEHAEILSDALYEVRKRAVSGKVGNKTVIHQLLRTVDPKDIRELLTA